MTQFAVFFIDPAAIGLKRLDAPDAAAAEGMVLELHPDAQVHAVDGALVTEENPHRMLAAWVRDPRQRPAVAERLWRSHGGGRFSPSQTGSGRFPAQISEPGLRRAKALIRPVGG